MNNPGITNRIIR